MKKKEGTGGKDGEEHKEGVQLYAGPTSVDGLPGMNKVGLVEEMVKNIRKDFSFMLDQLHWMDPVQLLRSSFLSKEAASAKRR